MKLHSLEYLLRGCVGEYQPMQVCVTGWDVGNPFEWRVREEVENSGQDLLFVKRWVSRWVMPKGDWTQERVWNVYRELDGARRQVQWLLSGGCGDGVWREVYVDTFCSVVAYMDALHNRCSAEEWYSEVEKLLLWWLLDFSVLDYRLLCSLRECDGRCILTWEMLKKWRSFVWGDRDESIPAQLYVWQSDIFGFEFLVEIDDIVSSKTESNRRLYSDGCVSRRDSLTDAESRNFRRCDFLWHCLFYLLRDGVRCGDKSIYYRQLVLHLAKCEDAMLDYMGCFDVMAQYGGGEEREKKLESILFSEYYQQRIVLGAFELYTRRVYDCATLWDDEMEDVFADDELYGFAHVFPTIKSEFPALWQKIEQVGGEEEQVADKNDETEHLIKKHLARLDGEYKGARFIPHNDYERLVGYVRELIATGKCPKDVEPIERLKRKTKRGVHIWGKEWVSLPIADLHDELFGGGSKDAEWADLVGKLCYEGNLKLGINKFRELPSDQNYEEIKKNVKF